MSTSSKNQNKTAEPLVRLTNAGKHYGTIIALSDITLEVGAGEVTCVLGDNGAGKSTEQLSHELESAGGSAAAVGAMLEEEAEELGTASHEPSRAASEPRTGIPPA